MFVLLALAIASCEKPSLESPTDVELVPEAGYIRFSTGVATKAPMIENMRGRNFGVLGYFYGYSTKAWTSGCMRIGRHQKQSLLWLSNHKGHET